MTQFNLDDYIKTEKNLSFLKRKALNQDDFIELEDPGSPALRLVDDLRPGNWTVIRGRHIKHNDVLLYASCGDRNKAHLSAEFAAESPFREVIAHGMIAVFKQRLLGRRIMPGMNFALVRQKKSFTAPVYVETSVLDFYEIVTEINHENKTLTTVGLSVLSNDYDKIVVRTESVYTPSAMFSLDKTQVPEADVMAGVADADPAMEVTFAEPGMPNHFSAEFFKEGQWARLTPNLRMNHLYALAGIGHMTETLHLADELNGKAEFLLSCADDAFRSAVLGTLLPAMGSIYQGEETWFLRPLKVGKLESRITIDTLKDSSRAVGLGLSGATTQDDELISYSRTRIFFPKPAE